MGSRILLSKPKELRFVISFSGLLTNGGTKIRKFRVSPTNGRTKIRLGWASDGFCKPDNQQKLIVKSGKVSSSIKHGQKSELSIYDEAAGKSTKSQILSHASKRIESRVCGNPLGEGRFGRVYIAREKTRKLLLSIVFEISSIRSCVRFWCYRTDSQLPRLHEIPIPVIVKERLLAAQVKKIKVFDCRCSSIYCMRQGQTQPSLRLSMINGASGVFLFDMLFIKKMDMKSIII
ncbi:hypothetical protein GLOIN_2v1836189 [Rhizophagus irregularis DAOM 181602=DAOM 197198]|nr:hypothetical protein GLOIN_2v1836189 [Rhizophagus irregularis DAOM 181602=DAOM 197198]